MALQKYEFENWYINVTYTYICYVYPRQSVIHPMGISVAMHSMSNVMFLLALSCMFVNFVVDISPRLI